MTSSLPQDLLTTNRIPDDQERTALRRLIATGNDKLHTIDQRVSELKAKLRELEDERFRLQEDLEPLLRADSPFRRLHEDVIRHIFMTCLGGWKNPPMSTREAPMLLTQISSGLRRIALATPSLWTDIHIPIIRLRSKHIAAAKIIMAKRTEGVKEWLLRRSGTLPLHISLYEPSDRLPPWEANPSLATDVEDILLQCSSRWQSITLTCSIKSIPRISTLQPENVPLLRSLSVKSELEFFSPQGDQVSAWAKSHLIQAPQITKFTIAGGAMMADYSLKWENLTHLHCRDTSSLTQESVRTIIPILRQTSKLISLELATLGPEPDSNIDELFLPLLQHLVYDEASHETYDGFQGLLTYINAPLLSSLSYNCDTDLVSPSSLVAIAKKSQKLEELTVGYLTAGNLLDCLTYCPSLSTLRLRGFNADLLPNTGDDDFLDAFVLDDDRCVCPQLENFVCSHILNVTMSCVRNFISRKSGNVERLRKWKMVQMEIEYSGAGVTEHAINDLGQQEGKDIDMRIFYMDPYRTQSLYDGCSYT